MNDLKKSMKKIKLTQNKFALVDDEDFEYLNQFKWQLNDNGYAVRSEHIYLGINKYKNNHIRMHREINKTPKELFTDHINRNKLDNRKSNLRTVTKSENAINTKLNSNNASGYKGIYWDKFTNKWRAEIKIFYKKISLGRFLNLEDAILARKEGEIKYHVI